MSLWKTKELRSARCRSIYGRKLIVQHGDLSCRPPDRLKRGGVAGHLKPITRYDLARRYGYFLDFLSRRTSLPMDGPAAGHVTSENIDAYLTEINQRVSSVTVYGSI